MAEAAEMKAKVRAKAAVVKTEAGTVVVVVKAGVGDLGWVLQLRAMVYSMGL
jgi:hypothetical protein